MKLNRFVVLCFMVLFTALTLVQGQLWAQGSYTYSINGEAVPGPSVYEAAYEIYGHDLGIGAFREPQDLTVSSTNQVYIADTGNNRIVVLNEELLVDKVITGFQNGEEMDALNTPTGLFVTDDGDLYVADYGNRRIVILDAAGDLQRTIENPTDQELIPEDFRFRPMKLVVDKVGRVYVIAEGVLEGLMEFDEQGIFSGFIGAPRVSPSPWEYFWRSVMTEAQKERSIIFVPTEYSNVDIDENGFIYTTLSRGQTNVRQLIRRLNPSGEDVLRRPRGGFPPPLGDVDFIESVGNPHATVTGRTAFTDIVVREHGIYSAVDLTRGRVFTYDDNGNLLYAFGSVSFEKGGFRNPSAITAIGERLLVLDRRMNLISVLDPTEYASLIHSAIALYQSGDYHGSADLWREVVYRNPNLDLAYSGIGRSLLRQGDFAGAMEMYRLGQDRAGYSQALQLYRREWINENFSYMMGGLIVLVVVGKVLSAWVKRRRHNSGEYRGLATRVSENKVKAFGQSLAYAWHVATRPADGFWDLKHEKRGNVLSATVILAGVVFSYILVRQHTGFLFNFNEAKDLNIYLEMSTILLPFFLWCGVNLGLTSLMEGKGTFKDIYIATAYALVPIIIINLPLILISRVITLEEGAFYYVFSTLAVLWMAALVFMGTMITHQYELGKNVFTSILTGVGIGIVIFLALLFLNVIAQLVGFIDSLYTEITFRI
ncbi:MAG: YIP1 family protein [Bacillota bacterium]|jgi:tetratricopeptide (TPR) repeat protein|nr:YIP1 family protein [Bacillota bacterium]